MNLHGNHKFDRRSALKLSMSAVAGASMFANPSVRASDNMGPKPVSSGKNFARYQFGNSTVIALRDGHVDMPPDRLQNSGHAVDQLPPGLALVEGQLRLSVNAFLIIDGQQSFLIDTGAGNSWLPTMGLLLNALEEAGVARDSIGNVALTHTHSDHVNGLIATDKSEAFPKLERIFVPEEEISIFSTSARLRSLREKVVPIDNNYPISDNISAVKATGHSQGHTAFELETGAGKLLFWGDIVHVPSAQFLNPELTWQLDGNQPEALEARRRMFQRAAQPEYFVAGAHLDFPGIGKVERATGGYRFKPTSA